jgi:hypothetical protein
MADQDPLTSLRRQAYRHTLKDGLADIVVGLYTLFVGGATQRRALLGLAVVYLLLYTIAWRVFHDQVSARRTGYAELSEQPHRILLTGSLAAATITLIAVAAMTLSAGTLWSLDSWPVWSSALAGVLLAAGLTHTAVRSGVGRYYAYAGLSIAASVFFWLFPFGPSINPSDRLTLFLFAMAGVMLLVGVFVLIRFRRAHPVVPLEARDGR